MDIQEQVKLTSNAKRGMKLNGIKIKNIEMLHLAPIELHSIITWKSITVHSNGPMNVACQYCKAFEFKNEADGLCCVSGQVKLKSLVPPPELLHSLLSANGPDPKHFLTHPGTQ